jgi:hypothetical protein
MVIPYYARAATLSILIGVFLTISWLSSRDTSSILLQSNGDDSVQSALHHLSSTSLVQRAAADCAADSKCIPTVDELVNRAAAACASDPACVCDWAKYPKKCFLSEVSRHKQLTHDAKELVAALRTREQAKALKLEKLKSHNSKFQSLLSKGRHDLAASSFGKAKKDLVQAEVQHRLTERFSNGRLDLHVPIDQTKELEVFAKAIVQKERSQRPKSTEVSSTVQNELGSLSNQIHSLMKKVAEGRVQHRDGVAHTRQESPADSTAAEIRALTEDVAKLTGKVSDLQHGIRLRPKRGRTEQLSDQTSDQSSPERGAVDRDRTVAINHQRTALAEALKRGRRAVERGEPAKAKTALMEVQYYRSALSRLEGRRDPCPACDSLQQETKSLSSDLDAPAKTTSLVDVSAAGHQSATALERAFDGFLSAGDRALVQGRLRAARAALRHAKGRFAELEATRLPGADGVIKHEMRDALRALSSNIATRAATPAVEPSAAPDVRVAAADRLRGVRGRRHSEARRHADDWSSDSSDADADAAAPHRATAAPSRRRSPAVARVRAPAGADVARRGRDRAAAAGRGNSDGRHRGGGRSAEAETPGASRLLRRMLARPGYYTPQTLRVATEGLRTATLRADGALEALDPAALSRIRKHFQTS